LVSGGAALQSVLSSGTNESADSRHNPKRNRGFGTNCHRLSPAVKTNGALRTPAPRKAMPPSPPAPKSQPYWLLRQAEQVTVAILIGAGLFSLIGWWAYHGGARGRTVEIEQAQPQSARFQVDINEADWPELATLPGVGQRLAERIVQWRDQNGPFADIDDLRRVRGIGARTLETLRPYLRPMHQHAAVVGN